MNQQTALGSHASIGVRGELLPRCLIGNATGNRIFDRVVEMERAVGGILGTESDMHGLSLRDDAARVSGAERLVARSGHDDAPGTRQLGQRLPQCPTPIMRFPSLSQAEIDDDGLAKLLRLLDEVATAIDDVCLRRAAELHHHDIGLIGHPDVASWIARPSIACSDSGHMGTMAFQIALSARAVVDRGARALVSIGKACRRLPFACLIPYVLDACRAVWVLEVGIPVVDPRVDDADKHTLTAHRPSSLVPNRGPYLGHASLLVCNVESWMYPGGIGLHASCARRNRRKDGHGGHGGHSQSTSKQGILSALHHLVLHFGSACLIPLPNGHPAFGIHRQIMEPSIIFRLAPLGRRRYRSHALYPLPRRMISCARSETSDQAPRRAVARRDSPLLPELFSRTMDQESSGFRTQWTEVLTSSRPPIHPEPDRE